MSVNIVLTGMMGCGKTTVGKALVKSLKDYIFVDLDEVIVDLEGISIPDIFDKKGEDYFRTLEEQLVEEFCEEENLILSLGGGAFESKKNREKLLNTGKVIYLKSSVDRLFERVKNDTNRPLLKCENPKGKLEKLLALREPNYLKSHYIVETDNKTIDEIANEILDLFK